MEDSTNELKLWLPELNELQLEWLQAHISLKVLEAECRVLAECMKIDQAEGGANYEQI